MLATAGDRAVAEHAHDNTAPSMAWALAERSMSDLAAFIEAGAALNAYDSRRWLPQLDVPTAVLITTGDIVVAPWRQEAMADLIPGSQRYLVDSNSAAHGASPGNPEGRVRVTGWPGGPRGRVPRAGGRVRAAHRATLGGAPDGAARAVPGRVR